MEDHGSALAGLFCWDGLLFWDRVRGRGARATFSFSLSSSFARPTDECVRRYVSLGRKNHYENYRGGTRRVAPGGGSVCGELLNANREETAYFSAAVHL
jgi:hypothetical protein